jgi:hypothetical protein
LVGFDYVCEREHPERRCANTLMAGLVPAIHVVPLARRWASARRPSSKREPAVWLDEVDGRDKPAMTERERRVADNLIAITA